MLDPDLVESESDDEFDGFVPDMVPGSEDADELRKAICALLKVFCLVSVACSFDCITFATALLVRKQAAVVSPNKGRVQGHMC